MTTAADLSREIPCAAPTATCDPPSKDAQPPVQPLVQPTDEVLVDPSVPLVETEGDELEVNDADVVEVEVIGESPAETPLAPAESADEPPPANIANFRQQLAERIASSSVLPRGLHQHLLHVLPQAAVAGPTGEALVPAEALLTAVEQWAPAALRLDPRSLRQPAHPAGEGFFTGDPGDVSDEQAAELARRQLQRAGYLPPSATA